MPYFLLSLAACFGGNYVVGHLLVAHADPIILSAARWIITALLLSLLYIRQIRAQWPMMKRRKVRSYFLRYADRLCSHSRCISACNILHLLMQLFIYLRRLPGFIDK